MSICARCLLPTPWDRLHCVDQTADQHCTACASHCRACGEAYIEDTNVDAARDGAA